MTTYWCYWQLPSWRKTRWVRIGHTYDSLLKAKIACSVLRGRGLRATYVIHGNKPRRESESVNCGRTCVS